MENNELKARNFVEAIRRTESVGGRAALMQSAEIMGFGAEVGAALATEGHLPESVKHKLLRQIFDSDNLSANSFACDMVEAFENAVDENRLAVDDVEKSDVVVLLTNHAQRSTETLKEFLDILISAYRPRPKTKARKTSAKSKARTTARKG